ncbi:MAG: KTSC domain-containing protein [Bacteroidales bacterium]|nr:KTSC domain-containing protein [Bacteroidales bacterium]
MLSLLDHANKKGGQRNPVSSSTIASIVYDTDKQILEIEFHHGAIYQYLHVPKEVYDGLMNAGSMGSYFINEIKTKFECPKS